MPCYVYMLTFRGAEFCLSSECAGLTTLACESEVYSMLPHHKSIARVYAQFVALIPDSITGLLPPSMQRVRAVRAQHAP